MTFSGHASNAEIWRYRRHEAYLRADRCGRPRSWCLSCEMQGKQSQKFPPPSSLSKIHLDYEGHICFLPQGSTGLAHTCRFSSVATPAATGDYFLLISHFQPLVSGLVQVSWHLPPPTYPSESFGFPWLLCWLS